MVVHDTCPLPMHLLCGLTRKQNLKVKIIASHKMSCSLQFCILSASLIAMKAGVMDSLICLCIYYTFLICYNIVLALRTYNYYCLQNFLSSVIINKIALPTTKSSAPTSLFLSDQSKPVVAYSSSFFMLVNYFRLPLKKKGINGSV